MNKVGIVVLADTETHEGLGRVVNALETAKEMAENDDDVRIVFDGAGTKWVAELSDEDHDAHGLYKAVEEHIDGACKFCAKAFGVQNAIEQTDIELLAEYDDHPSLRRLIQNGYQLITF